MKESALSTSSPLRVMRYGALSLALLGLLGLTGCSDNGMLRNRNFDYLHQDVQQLPPLKVPAGEPALTTTPYHAVPAGPNLYTPTSSTLLTPPGYAHAYDPKTIPAKVAEPVAAPAAVTAKPVATDLVAQKQADQQEAQALQTQLNELKQQAALQAPEATHAVPNTVAAPAAIHAPLATAASDNTSLLTQAEQVTAANRALEVKAAAPSRSVEEAVKPVALPAAQAMAPMPLSVTIPEAVIPPPVIIQDAPADSFLALSTSVQQASVAAPVYTAPVAATSGGEGSVALPEHVAPNYLLTLPETPAIGTGTIVKPPMEVHAVTEPVVAAPVAAKQPVAPAAVVRPVAVPAKMAVVKSETKPEAIPTPKVAKPEAAPVVAAAVVVAAKPVAVEPTSHAAAPMPTQAMAVVKPAAQPVGKPIAAPVPSASAIAAPKAAPAAVRPLPVAEPVTTPVVAASRLTSNLTQDAANVGTLKVQGAMLSVWQDLPNALQGSGFKPVSADLAQGYYFIAPVDVPARGHTLMLYVQPAAYHTTITVFGVDGRPDGRPEAYQLLQYLQIHLHGH